MDPGEHYALYGHAEGRHPNILAEQYNFVTGSRLKSKIGSIEDGIFIAMLHELFFHRGAAISEIEHYMLVLKNKFTSRDDLMRRFMDYAIQIEDFNLPKKKLKNDPSQTVLFGRKKMLSIKEWEHKKAEISSFAPSIFKKPFAKIEQIYNFFPVVTIITSLYKGEKYIKYFMDNITSQTFFEKCELLIYDALSPENEVEIIKPYLEKFRNIKYTKLEERLSIYETWNLGIRAAAGKFITNANVDDCRAKNSIETQVSTFTQLPFVDVVYQDVYYSFEENMSFEQIEIYDFRTNLPNLTKYNILEFNSPHNAPMWRKAIHEDVGLFNANFKSAGDMDFWMRCLVEGKIFYKINEPLVGYYVNPEGLSTHQDTVGMAEGQVISKKMNRKLFASEMMMAEDRFGELFLSYGQSEVPKQSRYQMVQQALIQHSNNSRRQKDVV